jgi:hypothetical protein
MADPLALPQQEGWGTAEIPRLAAYALPAERQTSLPSIEAIEQALADEAAQEPP